MEKYKPSSEEIDQIHLRSDELTNIIGQIPHWFLRYGISVIFIFVFVILVGCWFFKYPDIVTAKVEITANNPPATIIAKSTGKIEKVFIQDNQMVKKDDILAIIENTANFKDVLRVKSLMNALSDSLQLNISGNNYKLGDIQPAYSLFLKQCSDHNNFLVLCYHQKKIGAINHEISQQNEYLAALINKLRYAKEQLSLSKKQFQRDSLLFKNEVIPASDYERSQNQFLQVKSNYESTNTELISTKVQLSKLSQSILDLKSQQFEQTSQQSNTLKESYTTLMAKIADWEKAYVLKSPVTGKVTFTRFWSNNQNIKVDEPVFTVISPDFKCYVAKIQLPIQSSGKVKTGQKVMIQLDDYPYMEYGLLTGNISKISLVPDNGYYIAEIILPSKLITTYGTDISQRNSLKGTSEIIVKNQRLLYKFIYPIKSLISRNKIE
jgi:multidrug resistance efflux pump